jgi:hypothetical protein
MAGTEGLVFRQLFEKESSTYTYLLADAETKEVRVGGTRAEVGARGFVPVRRGVLAAGNPRLTRPPPALARPCSSTQCSRPRSATRTSSRTSA